MGLPIVREKVYLTLSVLSVTIWNVFANLIDENGISLTEVAFGGLLDFTQTVSSMSTFLTAAPMTWAVEECVAMGVGQAGWKVREQVEGGEWGPVSCKMMIWGSDKLDFTCIYNVLST